jgi:hypothetical protein
MANYHAPRGARRRHQNYRDRLPVGDADYLDYGVNHTRGGTIIDRRTFTRDVPVTVIEQEVYEVVTHQEPDEVVSYDVETTVPVTVTGTLALHPH